MNEEKTKDMRDFQSNMKGLPFNIKILSNKLNKTNKKNLQIKNAFNSSFTDNNKTIENNQNNNSTCNFNSIETNFYSTKSNNINSLNVKKDYAICCENNEEQKQTIPSIFNNINTLSLNKINENQNKIKERDFTHMEALKIPKQKKHDNNLLSNNNSSALDSKFVTIDTSSTEKNYRINNSILNNKTISQSNKKEFSRLNNSISNNNSRRNSREKSNEKTKTNNNNNIINNSRVQNNKITSKKEIPIHNFTFKINNNNNNYNNDDKTGSINIRKQVFSPINSIKAENLSAKNIQKENSENNDLNKITFNSKINNNSKTLNKIFPFVKNKETNIKSDSKQPNNLSKGKIRESSAYSGTKNSCSKEKSENADCVNALIGKIIESKGKRKDESSKSMNNDSYCANENLRKLKLNNNQKIENLPLLKIDYISKKSYNNYEKSISSKSKLTGDSRTPNLKQEDPSETLSNEKIVYLNTDIYSDKNPLEKSHKNITNKLNLYYKYSEQQSTSKFTSPNSSNIMNNNNNKNNNLDNTKNSKNLLDFKNININNFSNYLEKFNKKRTIANEEKIQNQKTFESSYTNKILSVNDNNLSSSRHIDQNDFDTSKSIIRYSVATEPNLRTNNVSNYCNLKGNCETANSGSFNNLLKPESVKKLKDSFKNNNNKNNYNNSIFQNTSLNKSSEKNKLNRIYTYDNIKYESNKFKLKNIENNNSNATLKDYVVIKDRENVRSSKNNSLNNKNRQSTKSNSKRKNNKINSSFSKYQNTIISNNKNNKNLSTLISTKENLEKLSRIKSPNELFKNSGILSSNKKVNDKNFHTIANNSIVIDTNSSAKAAKIPNACKIPLLKSSNSKKNLLDNNYNKSETVKENKGTENFKCKKDKADVFTASKISKNSSKEIYTIYHTNIKNNNNNNKNKNSSKEKKERKNSFEKTIHINHNFNHNINHNILINIENPDAVKTENLRNSLKKFYPSVASKKSTIENPRNGADAITSKIKDYSNMQLNNDEEYSEINIEYLHTDNPAIFGSENNLNKIINTIDSAKDNYMNLENFKNFNNVKNTEKLKDNTDSESFLKHNLEYFSGGKQNNSISNKNLNVFNSSTINNNNSSSKKIGEFTNISKSIIYNNSSNNKIFNNEIPTNMSNKFINKNSIKLNLDKNLNSLTELKHNLEKNSSLIADNKINIDNNNNNQSHNSKLNFNNEFKLDLSMKKSPNTSVSNTNNISSNLIIEHLKKNLLIKKINNNNNNNNNNNESNGNLDQSDLLNKQSEKSEALKNKHFCNLKSIDFIEKTDLSRGIVNIESLQKISEKDFIENIRYNFLEKNKQLNILKDLNLNANAIYNNIHGKSSKIKSNLNEANHSKGALYVNNNNNNPNLNMSSKAKNLLENNVSVNLSLKKNFATICHDKEIESKNNYNKTIVDGKTNKIPIEAKEINNFTKDENLNLFNIPKKLSLMKNKANLLESLNIKKNSHKKLSNTSNNLLTDEDSNADGNSKISKKNSKNKLNSQSFKNSSSSKSKSHSNSQNKETLPREKDLLEETISYIISDDELSTRRGNKNNTILNTEESEHKNIFQKSVQNIQNSNDEVDFEKFYEEMNWKLMNNPSSSSNNK